MISRLNYHHLYYFWRVAAEGHLTRTAERLHISQSALSAQIRQLEEQLGTPLFLREGKKLLLTEMGSSVLRYAEAIFALGNELLSATTSQDAGQGGQLRIGSVSTLSRNFLENFLNPVLSKQAVKLNLEAGGLEELLNRLSAYELDVVLSNRPVIADDKHPWRCRTLARQEVCLIGPPGLIGEGFDLGKVLTHHQLVVPSAKSEIRVRFDLLCEQLGIEPWIRAEVDDMAALRLLARDSGAVALIPAIVVKDELNKGLLEKYGSVHGVEETFYAITVRRRFETPHLKDLFQQFSMPG
ncbi:LysR family transcriptional regulator [Pseudogulbenkiania ferrooxidans]|uniref:Transcriptional regulator, LysR family n=1 Tax=Pseudogulbenkiania ferrooxidans 2002 TaxID=279714 RepID=B9YZV9_9NEIS|nr:LysR family transcriptional regulator [Pseudogulbenkiania ferrooxidans]EEG09842.1 transcriptional regulator, LysR family [Pseudogulbenkiania ferrooxidans 2002]